MMGSGQRLMAAVGLGQVCCLLLTVTGVTSNLLATHGVSLPTTQSAMNYVLLAVVFGVARRFSREPSRVAMWRYALLAFFDVEANFLVVMAYKYTSITSVSLTSAFSVPMVMLASHWMQAARYRALHVVGAIFAIAGLLILVLTDAHRRGDTTSGSNPLLGDILVVIGASLYAGTNVVQEQLLGAAPLAEVMANLGLCGAVLSVVQAALIEGQAVMQQVDWSRPIVAGALTGYIAALFGYYTIEPLILRLGGATTLNLSLLAANCWDAAARVFLLGGFSALAGRDFVVSLAFVTLGILCYSLAGPVKTPPRDAERGRGNGMHAPLLMDEETQEERRQDAAA